MTDEKRPPGTELLEQFGLRVPHESHGYMSTDGGCMRDYGTPKLPPGSAVISEVFSITYSGADESALALIDEAYGVECGHPTQNAPTMAECAELLRRLHTLRPAATFTASGPGYKLSCGADGEVRVNG